MMRYTLCKFVVLFVTTFCISFSDAIDKDEVDKLIEDEVTLKLADDLFQSLEKKFNVDLQNSVQMVLDKIKVLLQNGTLHIRDKLSDLQSQMVELKKQNEQKVTECLASMENYTTTVAESALHQMVVCGYALIGHDPSHAVKQVVVLKNMIKEQLKPIQDHKPEIYGLLRACGHDHDSLKAVIKCVISKSPVLKSGMMDVTSKLIEGIVTLTKLMAHGAMHEACLIEVVSTIADTSFGIVKGVRSCVYSNGTEHKILQEIEKGIYKEKANWYIAENNATVLDVPKSKKKDASNENSKYDVSNENGRRNAVDIEKTGKKSVGEIDDVIRRMLKDKSMLNKRSKKKLLKLRRNLKAFEKEIKQTTADIKSPEGNNMIKVQN